MKPSESEFESDWCAQIPLCDIILEEFHAKSPDPFLSLSGQGVHSNYFLIPRFPMQLSESAQKSPDTSAWESGMRSTINGVRMTIMI